MRPKAYEKYAALKNGAAISIISPKLQAAPLFSQINRLNHFESGYHCDVGLS